jgi:hypothetical protein
MSKITYLFGAGASKHALPLVYEIPDRIKDLIEKLESDDLQLDPNSTFDELGLQKAKSKREYQLELIDYLKWMMIESKNHASIDTFAKKLFIKRKFDDLKKLKIAMSVFFIFLQALKKPDYRYDSFFASIFNNLINLPDNIKIVSWNYDYQFELSFSEYSDKNEISANQNWLRVKSKNSNFDNDNGFGIYKLNGTTGIYTDRGSRDFIYTNNLKVPFNLSLVSEVTRSFASISNFNNFHSSLSFAWEKENPEKSIITHTIEEIKDSVALVVIGYSFPFFNRDIDRRIIGSMINLKRVYFQAPDADVLKERFQAMRDDLTGLELISKFDVGQFLLPNEL